MSVLPYFTIPLFLALAGCTLIDQRTFNPEAGRAPAVVGAAGPVVSARLDPRALFTLRSPAQLDKNAEAVLQTTIRAARARRPGVRFAVVAVIPTVAHDVATATAVYRTIIALGILPSHVVLRAEIGSPAEVRVYPE